MNTLIRRTPFADMTDLRNEMNRMFQEFFPVRQEGEDGGYESATWSPRVDLAESDDEYLISMDLPGINKEDVNINFEDGRLSVSGERKEEHTEEKRNYYRIERAYGRFFRSFNLPNTVNADGISANFDSGVLTVHVPKAEQSKPRQIKVS